MGFSADDDATFGGGGVGVGFDGDDLSPALYPDLLSQPPLSATQPKMMATTLYEGCGGGTSQDAGPGPLSRSMPSSGLARASPHNQYHHHHHHHYQGTTAPRATQDRHNLDEDGPAPSPFSSSSLFSSYSPFQPSSPASGLGFDSPAVLNDLDDPFPLGTDDATADAGARARAPQAIGDRFFAPDDEGAEACSPYTDLPRGHTFGVPGAEELRPDRSFEHPNNTSNSNLSDQGRDPMFDMLNLMPDGDQDTASTSTDNSTWAMEPAHHCIRSDTSDDDGDVVKEEEEENEDECAAPPTKRSKHGSRPPRSTAAIPADAFRKSKGNGRDKNGIGSSGSGGADDDGDDDGAMKQRSKRGSKNAMRPEQVKRAVLNRLSKDPRPTTISALRNLQEKLQQALPNEAVDVLHWGSLNPKERLAEEYTMLERLLGHTPDASAPTVHGFLALSPHQRRNAKARLRSIKNRQRTRENQEKTARQLAQANETIAQQQQTIEQQEQTIAELRQTLAKLRGMSPGLDNSDVSQASSPLLP